MREEGTGMRKECGRNVKRRETQERMKRTGMRDEKRVELGKTRNEDREGEKRKGWMKRGWIMHERKLMTVH